MIYLSACYTLAYDNVGVLFGGFNICIFGEHRLKNSKVNVRQIRERRGLSQVDFWTPLGVTQSGGSRYEKGRALPGPVQILLGIVYLGRKPPKSPKA